MRSFLALFVALFLVSCGVKSGTDGRDGTPGTIGPQGPSGDDAESPKCEIVEKDGKQYLRCENQDGSIAEVEIKPGRDGQDATGGKIVISTINCALSAQTDPTSSGYPKYDLNYQLVVMSDETAMASLTEKQHFRAGANPNFTSNAMVYVKGQAGYNLATVESTMWKAEVSAPKQVKFTYKAGSFSRVASCQ